MCRSRFEFLLIGLLGNAISDALPLKAAVPPVVFGFHTHSEPSYQISVKSVNPRRSYSDLSISDLSGGHHFEFARKWIPTTPWLSGPIVYQCIKFEHNHTMLKDELLMI